MVDLIVILGLSLAVYNCIVLPWMFHDYIHIGSCGHFALPLLIVGVILAAMTLSAATLAFFNHKRLHSMWRQKQIGWLSYSVTALILLLLAVVGLAGSLLLFLSQASMPDDAHLTTINGKDGEISIIREKNGAPVITAQTLRDALLGQGYVHAQDRLSQLFLERAASRGEVSTIVGKPGIAHDTMARTYNFNATAYAMCDGLSPFHRGLMRSYAKGINSYLASGPVFPPDMRLYAKKFLAPGIIEPWTIYDLCRSMVQYQTQLSSNCDAELKRWSTFWSTDSDEPYEVVEKLFPGQKHFRMDEGLKFSTILKEKDFGSPTGPVNVLVSSAERDARENESFSLEKQTYDEILHQFIHLREHPIRGLTNSSKYVRQASSAFRRMAKKQTVLSDVQDFALFQGGGIRGSNAWVVKSPELDRPILANDPHLDMYLPGAWHFSSMRILSKNEWYSGATHVGLPGVCAGSSNFLSWGLTLALTDVCDLFIITPDIGQPESHYMHNGKKLAYSTRRERICIRGSKPIELTIRETIYGPLLDNFKDPGAHCLAIWNAASQKEYATRSLESFLNFVTGIRTVKELRDKVLHGIAAPALSIVMTDQKNMGYAVTGLHPHRQQGHTGRYPIPGTGKFDHVGMIPMKELPWKITQGSATEKDFIIAGNNKIYPSAYKYRLGYEFSSNHRAIRMGELLSNGVKISVESMKELQLDSLSNIWVRNFQPWIAKNKSLRNKIPLLDRMLREWNGEITMGNRYAPVLWEYMDLVTEKFTKLYAVKRARHVDPMLCYFLTIDEAYVDIVEEAWEEATAKYNSPWGDDWGSVQLPHFSLASSVFSCLGNRYPSKMGGDFTSVNMIGGRKSPKATTRHFGPSLRLIIEAGRRVQYAIPGGFSENPFSKYYDNLLAGWSKGEYEEVRLVM
ncbi:penicillin amidase [Perkinsela sp. CCAP 1560/4]|nr:penicillin amidase [Perkinsela sp. CCAP 1560/4]|eukprot:KNH04771.1 penicillin amidase [Perkinsela sp. CCAP 1560/4]